MALRESPQEVPFLSFDRFWGDGSLAMNLVPLCESNPLDNLYFQREAWYQVIRRAICGSFVKNVQSAG